MAKMKKLKVIKTPKTRIKKNAKGEIELTDHCDQCGKKLVRTCARTVNSSVCAASEGILLMRTKDSIRFFCCGVCFNDAWGRVHEGI